MEYKIRLVAFLGLAVWLFAPGKASAQYTFTNIIDPSGSGGTSVSGISGNTVVGETFVSVGNPQGFMETGGVYTDFSTGPYGTWPLGITGTIVYGFYTGYNHAQNGFTYINGNFTTYDDPVAYSSSGSSVGGVSGNTVVGYYGDSSYNAHGFSETGGVYTTINEPLAGPEGTVITGISGNTIAGYYVDSSAVYHGFTETSGTFTSFTDPLAGSNQTLQTVVEGISGDTVFGYYKDSSGVDNGFLETDGTFTTFDAPDGADGTVVYGVSGTTVVGDYYDSESSSYGFIATEAVPEPANYGAVVLAALGLMIVLRKKRIRS